METEYHDDFEYEKPADTSSPPRHSDIPKLTISFIVAIFLFGIGIVNVSSSYGSSQKLEPVIHDNSISCKEPIVRREWRTLSNPEKQNYLRSVRCLLDQPSSLGFNHSMYEDFPWVHSRIGNFSHNTPAFIAWHRYFLNIYEKALQERCGYAGHLVYWDWTLDWQDMTRSPIWDSHNGFGGNGNITSDKSIGHGHCVTDGPFANRKLQYFGADHDEHCLSRGFVNGDRLKTLFGLKVHPDAIEKLLLQTDYETFNQALEDGPHNAIPKSIRGDFMRVTSPNDPLFFLHHTQLDRVWWEWQKRHPQGRVLQYGHKGHASDEIFRFDGFALDRKMSEVMSTETEVLCYRY